MIQLITCLCLCLTPIDYAKHYGNDYQDAIAFVKQNKSLFLDVAAQSETEAEALAAILFPELIRYSILKDFFETQALELLYIQEGSDAVDFSIGKFQMKPSFAEAVEAEIKQSSRLQIYFEELVLIDYKTPQEARKLRLERLREPFWQLKYAAALIKIVEFKFPELQAKSLSERISFFATAYNHGFQGNMSEIESWISKEFFPYGVNYPGSQHAYAAIAANFF